MKTQFAKLNTQSLYIPIVIFFLLMLFLPGCATAPMTKYGLVTFHINEITYVSLSSLCQQRGIAWDYDKFSRTVILSKDAHKINLMPGEKLILVDGQPVRFNYPVEIYQGTIAVPYRFKEQVIDSLFREFHPSRQIASSIAKIRKVVIDAGHGGNDPGAVGRSGLREKIVNLDIALRLSGLLRARGIDVVMTRSSDRFVPLGTRVDIANNSAADLFISIHSNANRVRSLSGFEVYYVSPTVNDSKRALSAAKEARLGLDSSCFASQSLDLKATLWDMIYTSSRAESIELSRALCRAMDNNLDTRILGIKGARFEVLRGVRMPGVLIEVGFLSNQNEEIKLKNSYFRQKIAENIVLGIQNYSQDAALMEVVRR